MADFFDYLDWRGDLLFSQVPPNEVDCLIFSGLCYIDFDGVVPEGFCNAVTLVQAAEAFAGQPQRMDRVRVKNDLKLLQRCARSPRFSQVRMLYYQNEFLPEEESQFAAVTFVLPDGTAVLSFRGTDDTLVGWKEDFNMSFRERVPAQEKARYYTEAFASVHDCPLILCGHSKGGNLAVYAASQCRSELRRRIGVIYNYDGPGFAPSMMTDAGYLETVPKVRTFIPESSVIGMLMEQEGDFQSVRSRQVSIMQHELYSWEILGGQFVKADGMGQDAWHLSQGIQTWLAGKSLQERNEFVDSMYELLSSGSVERTSQLILPRNVLNYLRALNDDEEMRSMIRTEFGSLLQSVMRVRRKKTAPQLEAPAKEEKSRT